MDLFKINFCVLTHARLANEVDNPLFAFVAGQIQAVGEIPNSAV